MTALQSVLFDLDGTLHSDRVAVPILVDAAARAGYVLDPAAVQQGERFVDRLQAEFGIDAAEADAIYAGYVELYAERAAGVVQVLDHAPELLAALSRKGVRLALVTQKSESLACIILDALGLREWFEVVIGGDSLPHRKPHPAVAQGALARLAGEPAAAASVGDTAYDMACGQGAGLAFRVGLQGVASAKALRDAGATHVTSNLYEAGVILLGEGQLSAVRQ